MASRDIGPGLGQRGAGSGGCGWLARYPRRWDLEAGRARKAGATLAAMLLALLFVSDAGAHVEVTPSRVAPASSHLFVFWVPNERGRADVVALRVAIPSGFLLADVQARPGWVSTVSRRFVSWGGGRIPPGQFQRFALFGQAPERQTALTFEVQERFSDGTVLRYLPAVQVGPAPVAIPQVRGRDQSARTLGEWALAVAVVGVAAVVLLGFALLTLWVLAPWETSRAGQPRPEDAAREIEPPGVSAGSRSTWPA